ncbi:MAG: hypothetical protein PHS73_01580 [Candidatus Peribacteraceae bacterium]|nr:hypothetical protein [Candidatus Peribacteraceae bacterium]
MKTSEVVSQILDQVIPEEEATGLLSGLEEMTADIYNKMPQELLPFKVDDPKQFSRKLRVRSRRKKKADLELQSVAAQGRLTLRNIISGVVQFPKIKELGDLEHGGDVDIGGLVTNLMLSAVNLWVQRNARIQDALIAEAREQLEAILMRDAVESHEKKPIDQRIFESYCFQEMERTERAQLESALLGETGGRRR